jgi:hypothetical protein
VGYGVLTWPAVFLDVDFEDFPFQYVVCQNEDVLELSEVADVEEVKGTT